MTVGLCVHVYACIWDVWKARCLLTGEDIGLFLVTSSPVNAILSNSRTLDGYPPGQQLYNNNNNNQRPLTQKSMPPAGNFITNNNVFMGCEQQPVLTSSAKRQRK